MTSSKKLMASSAALKTVSYVTFTVVLNCNVEGKHCRSQLRNEKVITQLLSTPTAAKRREGVVEVEYIHDSGDLDCLNANCRSSRIGSRLSFNKVELKDAREYQNYRYKARSWRDHVNSVCIFVLTCDNIGRILFTWITIARLPRFPGT